MQAICITCIDMIPYDTMNLLFFKLDTWQMQCQKLGNNYRSDVQVSFPLYGHSDVMPVFERCQTLLHPELTPRKDHHGVSSGWSSVWHRSNTGLSSTQYEQIPIILGVWPFWLTPFFSVNNILAGLWLNCISSVEITLFLLADILLQHRALFQC